MCARLSLVVNTQSRHKFIHMWKFSLRIFIQNIYDLFHFVVSPSMIMVICILLLYYSHSPSRCAGNVHSHSLLPMPWTHCVSIDSIQFTFKSHSIGPDQSPLYLRLFLLLLLLGRACDSSIEFFFVCSSVRFDMDFVGLKKEFRQSWVRYVVVQRSKNSDNRRLLFGISWK